MEEGRKLFFEEKERKNLLFDLFPPCFFSPKAFSFLLQKRRSKAAYQNKIGVDFYRLAENFPTFL